MIRLKSLSLCLLISAVCVGSLAVSTPVNTIADYNRTLPLWGTSWPGPQYYPSFYTGFAMRSEFPDRIHVRLSRGHNTRISVILDEQTVNDYLFDLAKRYEVYKKLTTNGPIKPLAKGTPQLAAFNAIIESGTYSILPTVAQARAGQISPEQLYLKSLAVLKALNPGRIYMIQLDLKAEFKKWQADMVKAGSVQAVTGSPAKTIEAINTLVFGRVNYTQTPNADVMAKLSAAVQAAQANSADFVAKAYDLFVAVTGTKYGMKVVNGAGRWQNAVNCSAERCMLTYPEFTTVYPTGSAMGMRMSDGQGNTIEGIRTPGLWSFISYGGNGSSREVDTIPPEGYYGYIPKMFYQSIGNAFHNPAVRFSGVGAGVKQALGIDPAHNTLWAVKRGGVSHGCSRLPAGSMWEMRHIFPVENDKMTQVYYFGSKSTDFDLYDINGDGKLEVMGVEYFISYNLQNAQGEGYREGQDGSITVSNDKKLEFYNTLYGSKGVFTASAGGFNFINPRVSMPSYLDYKKEAVTVRPQLQGNFPLYEQKYEQDKIQFYSLAGMDKMFIRYMGRIKGCAPTSNPQTCGSAASEAEAKAKGYVK